MTITPEQKQAVEQAGESPVRLEDPETSTTYLIVREDVYRKLSELAAIDHTDPSFFEIGEFRPTRKTGADSSPVYKDSTNLQDAVFS